MAKLLLACSFLLLTTFLHADVESTADFASDVPAATATLNYSDMQGNTVKTSLIADIDGKIGIGRNIFSLDTYFQFATEKNKEDKNLWWVSPQYDFRIIDELATNIQGTWKSDRYNGYWYQAYVGPGATYLPINDKDLLLSLQFNVFYEEDSVIFNSKINKEAYGSQPIRRYVALSPAMNFNWVFYQGMQFVQSFQYRIDPGFADNYFITSKSQLLLSFNKWFAFNITYMALYNNLAPPGRKKSDLTTSAGLTLNY